MGDLDASPACDDESHRYQAVLQQLGDVPKEELALRSELATDRRISTIVTPLAVAT